MALQSYRPVDRKKKRGLICHIPKDGPEKTLSARYENSSPRYSVRTVLLSNALVENFSGFLLQDKQNAS